MSGGPSEKWLRDESYRQLAAMDAADPDPDPEGERAVFVARRAERERRRAAEETV